uniref:Uncharacterized protein n=1 Tax=Rhizophora mucronata TaxID=61149 RepID=A0A2P2MZ87_RHIMU
MELSNLLHQMISSEVTHTRMNSSILGIFYHPRNPFLPVCYNLLMVSPILAPCVSSFRCLFSLFSHC